PDRLQEMRPVSIVVQHVQEKPAAVGAAIEVGERGRGLLARRSRLDARPAERGLDLGGVPPEAIGQERGRHHRAAPGPIALIERGHEDRKSTRLNSSHGSISYAVFCLKKKSSSLKPCVY